MGRRGGAERIDERSEVGGQRSENRGQIWPNGQKRRADDGGQTTGVSVQVSGNKREKADNPI